MNRKSRLLYLEPLYTCTDWLVKIRVLVIDIEAFHSNISHFLKNRKCQIHASVQLWTIKWPFLTCLHSFVHNGDSNSSKIDLERIVRDMLNIHRLKQVAHTAIARGRASGWCSWRLWAIETETRIEICQSQNKGWFMCYHVDRQNTSRFWTIVGFLKVYTLIILYSYRHCRCPYFSTLPCSGKVLEYQ